MSLIELHKQLRSAIREAMAAQGLQQLQIARSTGISQGHISNLLRGARKRVSLAILDTLAEATGVRIEARVFGPPPNLPGAGAAADEAPALDAPTRPMSARELHILTGLNQRQRAQKRRNRPASSPDSERMPWPEGHGRT